MEATPCRFAAVPLCKGDNAFSSCKGGEPPAKREPDRAKHQEEAAGGRSHDHTQEIHSFKPRLLLVLFFLFFFRGLDLNRGFREYVRIQFAEFERP